MFYTCHFCGDEVMVGGKHEEQCRPDLFPHEIGSNCTWAYKNMCYWDHTSNALSDIPLNTAQDG